MKVFQKQENLKLPVQDIEIQNDGNDNFDTFAPAKISKPLKIVSLKDDISDKLDLLLQKLTPIQKIFIYILMDLKWNCNFPCCNQQN